MTTGTIILLVALFLVIDLIVVCSIVTLAAAPAKKLAAAYPPVPPKPDAVVKRFQSFRIGMMGLGGCIHVAADEKYMHLTPARFARWFGVRAMSIPWTKIELTGKRYKGRGVAAKIDGKLDIVGPPWVMDLAADDSAEPAR